MRGIIIAGNWKMNKDVAEGETLVRDILVSLNGIALPEQVRVILCPPYLVIPAVAPLLRGTSLQLGAQHMHYENDGAYTGEISGSMLASAGCTHVIVGHSERRQYFGETDATVNRRAKKALEIGLKPIVCVGETLEEREAGVTNTVVERQLLGAFTDFSVEMMRATIIAYEPVWAIGTGKTATPAQAQEVHALIRAQVAQTDAGVAQGVRILYGGSVKGSNARELFAQSDIDGGLIGGAALVAQDFLAICAAAN